MQELSLHATHLIVLLVLLSAFAFAALAHRLQTPYPIVMVIGGLALGLIPGIPAITLNPELIFLVVQPPLLFSAGWIASWRVLSRSLANVAMLAVGLVAFTVIGVAGAGPWLFPAFDWRTGLVLGAAVATTDAIAATSIAKRVGLPRRIADLLENESLVNDATGLLALEFAVSLLMEGRAPAPGASLFRFVYLMLGGIASGLIVGRAVEWCGRRIEHGPTQIGVGILAAYAADLAAESVHASGVLAAVAAGLYLGRKSSEFLSPAIRVQARSVWSTLTFLLNGFVFVSIGLQLPTVLAGVRGLSAGRLAIDGILFSVFLIAIRLLWTLASVYALHFIRVRLLRRSVRRPELRETFLIGWTGMRGVVSLAAAMSLPDVLGDGSPFPNRELIVFLTFSVILVTLVGQGLTLPPLIRGLKLAGSAASAGEGREGEEARRAVLETALNRLEEMRRADETASAELYRDLERHYRQRLSGIGHGSVEGEGSIAEEYFRYIELSRALLDVERRTALRLRDEGGVTDEVLREIEHELDLDEIRLRLGRDWGSVEAM